MPIDKYYKGHGDEVMSNMKKEYGAKKGEQVFYATANKKGMNAEAEGDDKKDINGRPAKQPSRGQGTGEDPNWYHPDEVKEQKDTRMKPLTVKLLEAIRAKDWHTANELFTRTMQERMIARVDDIKTRVMMEDTTKCELCGGTKNLKVLDDGTAICKDCDVEEEYQPKTGQACSCKPGQERDNCPSCEGTGQRIDFAKIRAKNVKEDDELNSLEKGDGTDNGGPMNEKEGDTRRTKMAAWAKKHKK
jgi:hypothetical protein